MGLNSLVGRAAAEQAEGPGLNSGLVLVQYFCRLDHYAGCLSGSLPESIFLIYTMKSVLFRILPLQGQTVTFNRVTIENVCIF